MCNVPLQQHRTGVVFPAGLPHTLWLSLFITVSSDVLGNGFLRSPSHFTVILLRQRPPLIVDGERLEITAKRLESLALVTHWTQQSVNSGLEGKASLTVWEPQTDALGETSGP
ncbi:unnamed protein product [Lota lota]